MAGQVRSLYESGDGLELALDAKRRKSIAAAEQFAFRSSALAGVRLVADILDLEYRLPRLYAALHRGQVEAWRMRGPPAPPGT